MPVIDVRDRARLASDHVFVVPSDHDVTIHRGELVLQRTVVPRAPLDKLLRAVADELGRESTAVILAGRGVGIPADMLPRIFEIFVQCRDSLGRSQGELGIGLNLVQRLVELHGGQVSASSAGENAGSEFVVELPCTLR